MPDWNEIANRIGEATGKPFTVRGRTGLGGGCINASFRLTGDNRSFFVKTNQASLIEMFRAESLGLDLIVASGSIRAPRPICTGISGGEAYLVLEYISLSARGDDRQAGRQLANMHLCRSDQFGWDRDNTIGSTIQPNGNSGDWIGFWREQRLGFQLELATSRGRNNQLQRRGEKLMALFDPLIDHDPQPSLIHGDLWSGNLAYADGGEPVIYDPAVYYADREADLAMTELFGRQSNGFYAAYNDRWPLDSGYPVRRDLYNLYHVLNHFNLFGGGYGGQALSMIDRLLAELGH